MLLDNLSLFLRIVEKGGMAAAGRELGLSPATVSERLAALEAHYGARLLNRTTRSLSLTDEGRDLVEGAQRLLNEAEDLETRIRLGVNRVAGIIHVHAPVDLGRNKLSGVFDAFLDEHPEVSIDLTLGDGYVDLAGMGADLAIRYGALGDSSLKLRKLADSARIVVASPAYLARCGTPATPDDLLHHNCLLMRFGTDADRFWPFEKDGRKQVLAVRGNRIANDGGLVRKWCVKGHGIARKSQWDIADDLAAGRLIPLLQDYEVAPIPLQVVYPPGQNQPRRVRLLLEALVQAFAEDEQSD
ncbi:LysR family transcriptional regulator [Profundibacter sp.]|uniref:LysR family transcriptional regulator n=1 Tax=Profundibacter sp. TaxID=3101071 RepID=UPI003D120AF6